MRTTKGFPAKNGFCVLVLVGWMAGLTIPAEAGLIDRGLFDADGIPGGSTVRLIYDNDLGITWLGDTNFAKTSGHDADGAMSWANAMAWAASLTVGGYSDWRLPTSPNQDGTGPCAGFNCTGSEMGHLFYSELGGVANQSIFTSVDPDLVLFSGLAPAIYWSSTQFNAQNVWQFNWGLGFQGAGLTTGPFFAWAVRTGDVLAPVPEPSTLLLSGIGLAGIYGYIRRRRMKGAG